MYFSRFGAEHVKPLVIGFSTLQYDEVDSEA